MTRYEVGSWIDKQKELFAQDPNRRIRAVTAITRSFLLCCPKMTIDGMEYSSASKSLGAGVYEIFLNKIPIEETKEYKEVVDEVSTEAGIACLDELKELGMK